MKNFQLAIIFLIPHWSLLIERSDCGVGGSRTLVQTSSKIVFYMLSFRLIVGNKPAGNGPICNLVPYFSSVHRNPGRTISTFAMPRPEHR